MYGPAVERAPHTASGPGLESALAGETAHFTIQLVQEDGELQKKAGRWNTEWDRLIYVWIANTEHIFIAEVRNNGDGTLTASYSSDFVGTYLIYIDDILLGEKHAAGEDAGRPIMGSPFVLEITGAPTAPDFDSLPLCVRENGGGVSSFWRPGSWVSSRVASAKHGVLRSGWVFQPEDCVYDTFSYDELMAIASSDSPTWVLVLGGSVQRGLFLTLVDMVLAKEQKHQLASSALHRCWGWSDIRIGNLRVSYQVRCQAASRLGE